MNQGFNQGMIERARERTPNGRPVKLRFAVDVWTDQCNTNTALTLEALFINFCKDVGLQWLGTHYKRVDDPTRRHSQIKLFTEDDA